MILLDIRDRPFLAKSSSMGNIVVFSRCHALPAIAPWPVVVPWSTPMTTPHVEIYPTHDALVARSRDLVAERITAAVRDRGRCFIALAGGSTPKPLYAALATADLPWQQLYIFWGDERYVPITHPDSNAGMAKAAWLDQVPIPPDQIFPVPTSAADPQVTAKTYETMLKQAFGTAEDFPSFDIILLGMGDDGHTASLFPHTAALSVRDRGVTVGQKDADPRITFTVPLINHSRCVLFLVSGASKQAALTQVFSPAGDATAYPSRLIAPAGELWWLLDHGAGEPLRDRPGVLWV